MYCKWEINDKDVVPLSFSAYGGTAKETMLFLDELLTCWRRRIPT